jgi:hypothetical protein
MTTDTGGWTLVSQAVPTTNTSLTLCNSAVVERWNSTLYSVARTG